MVLSDEISTDVKQFANLLNLGRTQSSYNMALKTLDIITKHVRSDSWSTAQQLIDDLRRIKDTLKAAEPSETVPQNMILRCLKVIRDEYTRLGQGREDTQEADSGLEIMDVMSPEEDTDYSREIDGLRDAILGFCEEWEAEVEVSAENIAKEALQHIVKDEVILTLGSSKTVEAFLKRAATARTFQVIVAEAAPFCHGQDMAISLAKSGIQATVIPDSAIFSVLSRVTRVIIGTHSVMANGGLKAVSGAYTLALAAKHHAVPLIVLAAMFKYSPEFLVTHDESFNKRLTPSSVLPFSKTDLVKRVDAVNPVFDYVPPELVSVLIAGEREGHSPSYVYHKLTTLYHRKDYLSID